MYILDFLKSINIQTSVEEKVGFEYRLLCSGELYNGVIQTTDWRKSDATRILFLHPFTLIICSYPFEDYPQELCLRFSTQMVTETKNNSSIVFYPDDEIANDLASLISLLLRRLITVICKTRELYPESRHRSNNIFQDWPIGLANKINTTSWERKTATVIYGPDGVKDLIDYNPPPLGIDPDKIISILQNLPRINQAKSLILSARLYSQALEQINQNANLSYQFLIQCVEAIANDHYRLYSPSRQDLIQTKESVLKMAIEFGLEKERAEELAIEACKGINWAYRKFKKFLLEFTDETIWDVDDLFNIPDFYKPQQDNFHQLLSTIYYVRGKAFHRGRTFPMGAAIGSTPYIPFRFILDLNETEIPFPPVVWFEKVVNNAVVNFVEKEIDSI